MNELRRQLGNDIQVEDIKSIADELKNNTTAAILLAENLWAVRLVQAVDRADGQVIDQIRIPHKVVEETLAIFANAE